MSSRITKTLAAAVTLSATALPTAAHAHPVPAAEAKARASCVAEAKRLKVKVPAGACQDPRSRLKFLTKAREMCAKGHSVASGQVKCTGTVVKD